LSVFKQAEVEEGCSKGSLESIQSPAHLLSPHSMTLIVLFGFHRKRRARLPRSKEEEVEEEEAEHSSALRRVLYFSPSSSSSRRRRQSVRFGPERRR